MFRRPLVVAALVVLMGIGAWAVPAAEAQEAARPERILLDLSSAASNTVVPPVFLATDQANTLTGYRKPGPSSLMTSLYATTAAMQVLDVHSTMAALNRGAVESNPLMTRVTGNKAAFLALKAGVAFGTVMAARNLSKRNKVAAVMSLVAINSAYAMIVSHNYRVARQLR